MHGDDFFDKNRIIISNPEKYNKVEIRTLTYDDGEGLAGGYNGNVIVGYGDSGEKDVFFLSINKINEKDMEAVCDKIEESFGEEMINLMIYNGDSTIYNLNDSSGEE